MCIRDRSCIEFFLVFAYQLDKFIHSRSSFDIPFMRTDVAIVQTVSYTHLSSHFSLTKPIYPTATVISNSKFRIELSENILSKKFYKNLTATLSLETPHCWYWSLYFDGIFYDPEYGVLEEFPPSVRRYYWEIKAD